MEVQVKGELYVSHVFLYLFDATDGAESEVLHTTCCLLPDSLGLRRP